MVLQPEDGRLMRSLSLSFSQRMAGSCARSPSRSSHLARERRGPLFMRSTLPQVSFPSHFLAFLPKPPPLSLYLSFSSSREVWRQHVPPRPLRSRTFLHFLRPNSSLPSIHAPVPRLRASALCFTSWGSALLCLCHPYHVLRVWSSKGRPIRCST
jgi:hypothetical protein